MFAIGVENLAAAWTVMLVGAAAALALGWVRASKEKVKGTKLAMLTAALPLAAAFMSHLSWCLTSVGAVLGVEPFGFLLSFWQRGHMMYGGMLGVVLTLLLGGGKERAKLMEAYAPGGALMIAVCRITEGLLGQGFGEYIYEEGALCSFPWMVFDPYYEVWAWALFMLEALIAVVLFVLLLSRKPLFDGDSALIMIGLYASAQVVLESLRRDEFMRWGFVRCEELMSAVAIAVVLVCYCVRAGKGRVLSKTLCFVAFALLVTFCVLLEFATEGRIPFLRFLNVEACYITMACSCVALAVCVYWMRSISKRKKESM